MTGQSNTRRNSKVSAVRCLFLAIALVYVAGYSFAAEDAAPESQGKIDERYEDTV